MPSPDCMQAGRGAVVAASLVYRLSCDNYRFADTPQHGGRRPWCAHGLKVTKTVAPLTLRPRAAASCHATSLRRGNRLPVARGLSPEKCQRRQR